MKSRAVKHNPEIVYANAEYFTDLFTAQAIDFSKRERAGRALW
jgi:hypothetical protein